MKLMAVNTYNKQTQGGVFTLQKCVSSESYVPSEISFFYPQFHSYNESQGST